MVIYIALFYIAAQFAYSKHHFKKARDLSKVVYTKSFKLIGKGKSKLKILMVGDSIAAGVGASSFENSIPGRLVKYFSGSHRLDFINKARAGMKIRDLLDIPLPKVKQDIVVLIVSSNDVFHFTNLNEFSDSVVEVLDKYSKLTKKLIFLGPGKISTAPALALPIRIIYKTLESRYTSILEEKTSKYSNVTYIKPGNPPRGTFANDKFHPNDEGHRVGFEVIKEAA